MTVGNQYKNAVVQTKADDKKYGREQDVRTLDLIRKCRHLLKKQQKKTETKHKDRSSAFREKRCKRPPVRTSAAALPDSETYVLPGFTQNVGNRSKPGS